jgi:hypothetical protein
MMVKIFKNLNLNKQLEKICQKRVYLFDYKFIFLKKYIIIIYIYIIFIIYYN